MYVRNLGLKFVEDGRLINEILIKKNLLLFLSLKK